MRIKTDTLHTIERFFADSFELAIVGATETSSQVIKIIFLIVLVLEEENHYC